MHFLSEPLEHVYQIPTPNVFCESDILDQKGHIVDMYCMAIMRFKSVFIVVEVVLLQSPRSESGKAPQSVPPDHKQNPVLIKQLKDPGKNSQQIVNLHTIACHTVCTCEMFLTVDSCICQERSPLSLK